MPSTQSPIAAVESERERVLDGIRVLRNEERALLSRLRGRDDPGTDSPEVCERNFVGGQVRARAQAACARLEHLELIQAWRRECFLILFVLGAAAALGSFIIHVGPSGSASAPWWVVAWAIVFSGGCLQLWRRPRDFGAANLRHLLEEEVQDVEGFAFAHRMTEEEVSRAGHPPHARTLSRLAGMTEVADRLITESLWPGRHGLRFVDDVRLRSRHGRMTASGFIGGGVLSGMLFEAGVLGPSLSSVIVALGIPALVAVVFSLIGQPGALKTIEMETEIELSMVERRLRIAKRQSEIRGIEGELLKADLSRRIERLRQERAAFLTELGRLEELGNRDEAELLRKNIQKIDDRLKSLANGSLPAALSP